MIAKSSTGGSFRGLSNYLEKGEKTQWKESQNLPGVNRNQDIRLMEETASMSKAEKPVYHLSVSYSPADNPSKEMMLEDMTATLEKLGLGDKQAVFVAHDDKDYKHVHAMVNRVDPSEGKAWNPWQDKAKCKDVMRELETQRGYAKVSERNWSRNQDLTRGEYQQLRDNPKDLPIKAQAEIHDFRELFDQAERWDDIDAPLSELDLRIKRKGRGAVIEDTATGKELKLSRIGSDHGRHQSFGRLEKRLGSRKQHEKLLGAQKDIKKHISDRKVAKNLGKIARESISKKGVSKGTKKLFKKSIKNSFRIKKTIQGLSSLASSSNPVSGIAKAGLKIAKKINRNINQNRGRGLSR